MWYSQEIGLKADNAGSKARKFGSSTNYKSHAKGGCQAKVFSLANTLKLRWYPL
jgi:hypothetical protein